MQACVHVQMCTRERVQRGISTQCECGCVCMCVHIYADMYVCVSVHTGGRLGLT